jgi:hypothetical protein
VGKMHTNSSLDVHMSLTTWTRQCAVIGATALATLTAPMAAHALVNGTDTSSYGAVGEIGSATGVLIADNWVLTAGHVADATAVGTGSFVTLTGSSVIDAAYVFSDAAFPNNDIGLLHLSSPITGVSTPVLSDQTLNTTRQLNALGALTVVTAQNQSPNGVGSVSANSLMKTYVDADGISYTTNWLVTNGEVSVEGGDSGSALFLGAVADSANAVMLGVASADITDSNNNPLSAFVLLAPYKAWITSTMASSGQTAKWVSTVPEAATWMQMGLGLVGMLGMMAHHRAGQRRLRRQQA